MKVVKIVIVFVAILGVVGLTFFLRSNNNGIDIEEPSSELFETYRTQIENAWAQSEDWNAEIFNRHCDLIAQLSCNGTLQTELLADKNMLMAIEIVYKNIFKEWRSTSCRRKVIDSYMEAVAIIEGACGKASGDPNIKQIKAVDKSYRAALGLAYESIGKQPQFDGLTWKAYSTYSNNMDSRLKAVYGDANYQTYLSNITDIKNRLNAIPDKLEQGRKRFYSELARDIVEFYQYIPSSERTSNHLKCLDGLRDRYEREYSLSNSDLKKFISQFQLDVRTNEANAEKTAN